jgi:NAD+ diphosphatase
LPGGFVNASETPESAVTRELLEETNLEIAAPVLQAVYADTERGVLLITFAAAIVGGTIALDPDECADARFFARSELPSEDELAFETGRTAIIAWRDRRSPLH